MVSVCTPVEVHIWNHPSLVSARHLSCPFTFIKKKKKKQGYGTLMAEMSTEHNFGDKMDSTLLGEYFKYYISCQSAKVPSRDTTSDHF